MSRQVISLTGSLALLLALSAPAVAVEFPATSTAHLALNAVQALVDQQLSSIQGSLSVLATAAEVQALDWDTMQPLLASFQEHCPPCAVWFALPDGTYYTVQNGLMDQALTDRMYFAPLFSGEDILGATVVSKSTSQLSAVVAAPVFRDGQIVGALGASVFIQDMADYLASSLELPAEISLLVISAQNEPVLSLPAADEPWMIEVSTATFEDYAGTLKLANAGEPLVALYQTSGLNGWRYVLAMQDN